MLHPLLYYTDAGRFCNIIYLMARDMRGRADEGDAVYPPRDVGDLLIRSEPSMMRAVSLS